MQKCLIPQQYDAKGVPGRSFILINGRQRRSTDTHIGLPSLIIRMLHFVYSWGPSDHMTVCKYMRGDAFTHVNKHILTNTHSHKHANTHAHPTDKGERVWGSYVKKFIINFIAASTIYGLISAVAQM